MTPFRTALTGLASLTVAGITHNYDVDAVPDDLSRAQLPALLVLPGDVGGAKQRGAGFEALAFSSGARTVACAVTHLLLVAPTNTGRGARSHLPGLIDLIDAYFTALGANVTLSGALIEPARVQVEPGVFTYGGIAYHGCAFRHTWLIQV
jgi:hypothetical protein